MSQAAAWRWSLAAGLVAFACSWGFGRIPGLVACGPTGGLGPIIAFEFAHTSAEVAALFGAEPCRSTLVAAQRTGLWLDALGFIPAYTAFLSLAARAVAGRAAWPIIAGLLLAGLADEVEGVFLSAILRDLPGEPGVLGALFWAVHAKFALLALGSAAIGLTLFYMALAKRQWAGFLGLLVGTGGTRALVDQVTGDRAGIMLQFTIAWVALLLAVVIGAVWPRLLAPRPRAPALPNA